MFQANDGSYHYDQGSYDEYQKKLLAGGGSGTAGFGGVGANILIGMLIFGPIIAAKIAGFLFGLFSKAGVFGRVMQTLVFNAIPGGVALIVIQIAYNVVGVNSVYSLIAVISVIIIVLLCLIIAIWFFNSHYFTVKAMGVTVFSNTIEKSMTFIWWGYLIAVLIVFFTSNVYITGIIAGTSTIAAVIFYIKRSLAFAPTAIIFKKETKLAPIAFIVTMILVLVLNTVPAFALSYVIYGDVFSAIASGERKQRDDRGETITVAFHNTKLYVKNPANMKDGQNETNVIQTIDRGYQLTVTGKASRQYVPVTFEGKKVWIRMSETTLDPNAMEEGEKFQRLIDASKKAHLQKVTVRMIYDGMSVHSNLPLNSSNRMGRIEGKGAVLYVVDEAVSTKRGTYLIVEYQGARGFIPADAVELVD